MFIPSEVICTLIVLKVVTHNYTNVRRKVKILQAALLLSSLSLFRLWDSWYCMFLDNSSSKYFMRFHIQRSLLFTYLYFALYPPKLWHFLHKTSIKDTLFDCNTEAKSHYTAHSSAMSSFLVSSYDQHANFFIFILSFKETG